MSASSAVLKFFNNTSKGEEKSKFISTLNGMIVFPDQELEKVIADNHWVNNFSIRVEYLIRATVIFAFLPVDFDKSDPWKIIVHAKKDPLSFPTGALVDFPNFASSLERLNFSGNLDEIIHYIESILAKRKFEWVRFFYSVDELTPFAQKALIKLRGNKKDSWELIEITDKVIRDDHGSSFLKRKTDITLAADFMAEIQRDDVRTMALFSGDADFFPFGQLWLGRGRYQDVANNQRSLIIVSSQNLISVELREIANDSQCLLFFLENVVDGIPGKQLKLSL